MCVCVSLYSCGSAGLPMQLTFFLNPGDVIGSSTTATGMCFLLCVCVRVRVRVHVRVCVCVRVCAAVAGVYGKVILEKASKMCLLPIDPNLFK